MRDKTFSTHIVVKKCHLVREKAGFTHDMKNIELVVRGKRFNAHVRPESHSKGQPGRGRRVKPALAPEKRGPTLVGRTGGILRPHPVLLCHMVF